MLIIYKCLLFINAIFVHKDTVITLLSKSDIDIQSNDGNTTLIRDFQNAGIS
jgi:hypothetical protein